MTSPWRCAGSFSAPPKQQFLWGGRVKSALKAREEEESGTYTNNKAFEALREVLKLQRHEQQRDVVGTDGDGKNDGTTGGDDVDVVVAAQDEERKTTTTTTTTTKTKKKPKNPFEEARRKPSASTTTASNSSLKTFSFVKSTVDVSKLPSLRDADVTLRRFDDEARKRLSSSSSSSSSASCAERSLGNAVRALSYNAETIMFGICAQTGHEGIDALKVWTEELNLPKGKLHGLDTDGVPKPIPEGPVFIKYNSLSGDAFCSEYHGEFRGVLFTPVLNDGVFRQFGYLDLSLLDDDDDDEKNKT